PLHEPAVEIEALRVRRPAPVGLDARPGDREAVAAQPERAHQLEVAGPAVVVVAGLVAGVTVRDLPGRAAEAVPDRLPATVGVRRALDLEGGRRCTPDEFARERHLALHRPAHD